MRALEADQSWSQARQQSSCTTLGLVSPPVCGGGSLPGTRGLLLDAAPLRCRRGEGEWSTQRERRNSFKQENLGGGATPRGVGAKRALVARGPANSRLECALCTWHARLVVHSNTHTRHASVSHADMKSSEMQEYMIPITSKPVALEDPFLHSGSHSSLRVAPAVRVL